jgi:hypothetical protein
VGLAAAKTLALCAFCKPAIVTCKDDTTGQTDGLLSVSLNEENVIGTGSVPAAAGSNLLVHSDCRLPISTQYVLLRRGIAFLP